MCYGGHGKRSLSPGSGSGTGVGGGMGETASGGQEPDYVRPNGLLPMMAPNEQVPLEGDFNDYPARQVLYKIMKSWVSDLYVPLYIWQHFRMKVVI